VAYPTLKPVGWAAVAFWQDDTVSETWSAFLHSCSTLVKRTAWQAVCSEAATMGTPDDAAMRAFFERRFRPYQAAQEDGSTEGMVTGYYEPLLKGDRVRTARARFPLYAAPDDLVSVELASVYPELKNLRLRGRLVGNKLVPYPTRKEIGTAGDGFKGKPIAWAEDPVDLFFLQIQGSGRIELPDGSHMRVGYADQNGHPYQSIGKLLVERGELKLEQASMPGIKNWGAKNPDKLQQLRALALHALCAQPVLPRAARQSARPAGRARRAADRRPLDRRRPALRSTRRAHLPRHHPAQFGAAAEPTGDGAGYRQRHSRRRARRLLLGLRRQGR
jgi:membrane-bound lytic murein transglycosylase A